MAVSHPPVLRDGRSSDLDAERVERRAGPAQSLTLHGVRVSGVAIDAQTRCAHYHAPFDVVALKFKCCGEWHPCIDCHRAVAGHAVAVWPIAERSERAVLCGVCGARLAIAEYLASACACPRCGVAFNPGCAMHRHLYFEMR